MEWRKELHSSDLTVFPTVREPSKWTLVFSFYLKSVALTTIIIAKDFFVGHGRNSSEKQTCNQQLRITWIKQCQDGGIWKWKKKEEEVGLIFRRLKFLQEDIQRKVTRVALSAPTVLWRAEKSTCLAGFGENLHGSWRTGDCHNVTAHLGP